MATKPPIGEYFNRKKALERQEAEAQEVTHTVVDNSTKSTPAEMSQADFSYGKAAPRAPRPSREELEAKIAAKKK